MKLSENGKIFGKISIIDVLVVAIACALIIGAYKRFNTIGYQKNDNVVNLNYKYEVLIKYISPSTVDMLKEGDIVYDKTSNTLIGKIVAIEANVATSEFQTKTGEILLKNVEGKMDVKLTIETSGIIKEQQYLANGLIRTLVGEQKTIKTKYVNVICTVINIENSEE